MSTYSINISNIFPFISPTETTSYFLTGDLGTSSNFRLLLDRLPDNLDKLIEPRDLRDLMLSITDSIGFKQTKLTSSNIEYIGIDAGNPINRDLKRKILLGKNSFSGTFSYSDPQTMHVMLGLTGSDSDVFIYNTKNDTQQQVRTRIQILSGTNYSLNNQMPYIQSQVVQGLSESRSFDFVNPIGDINMGSDQFGNININSITFSNIQQLQSQQSNDKVLIWNGTEMEFGDLILPITNNLGTQSDPLFILGNPTNLNGYSLEFTDSRKSSFLVGDIQYGSTFSNSPLEEMLRRIIYDYSPPTSSVEILPPFNLGVAEVGSFPAPIIKWSINKKTLPTLQTSLTNMIPGSYPPITNSGYQTISGQSNGVVISPIGTQSTTFSVIVSDGTQSNTSSTSIKGIYPYFWGFSDLITMTTIGLQNLQKFILEEGDKEVEVFGQGNFYFIYPSDYNNLVDIKDQNNSSIIGSFSTSTQNFSSPFGLWAGKLFKVYKIENIIQNTPVIWSFENNI
jgi:hypothetical protein